MRLAFLSSHSPAAQADGAALAQRYGHCDPADADIVVALGGDGFLLDTLHGLGPHAPPVFGINRGTVGFLMNPHTTTDDLPLSITGNTTYVAGVTYSRFGEVLRTEAGPAGRKLFSSYYYDEFSRQLTRTVHDRGVQPVTSRRVASDNPGISTGNAVSVHLTERFSYGH